MRDRIANEICEKARDKQGQRPAPTLTGSALGKGFVSRSHLSVVAEMEARKEFYAFHRADQFLSNIVEIC
jgi:hypothetical protein